VSRRSSARSMIPTVAYHGAHEDTVDAEPLERWEGTRCVTFVHDIMSSPTLPDQYGPCDVLVTDLPWQRGFETFNERAGVDDGRTYAQFMAVCRRSSRASRCQCGWSLDGMPCRNSRRRRSAGHAAERRHRGRHRLSPRGRRLTAGTG
jgi:hypothetical protein